MRDGAWTIPVDAISKTRRWKMEDGRIVVQICTGLAGLTDELGRAS